MLFVNSGVNKFVVVVHCIITVLYSSDCKEKERNEGGRGRGRKGGRKEGRKEGSLVHSKWRELVSRA